MYYLQHVFSGEKGPEQEVQFFRTKDEAWEQSVRENVKKVLEQMGMNSQEIGSFLRVLKKFFEKRRFLTIEGEPLVDFDKFVIGKVKESVVLNMEIFDEESLVDQLRNSLIAYQNRQGRREFELDSEHYRVLQRLFDLDSATSSSHSSS